MRKASGLVKTGFDRSLYKVRVISKITNFSKKNFNFIDIISESIQSCQLYKFKCGSCNTSYINKTYAYEKKCFKTTGCVILNPTQVKLWKEICPYPRNHILECDHKEALDDFTVVGSESYNWLMETKKDLFSKGDK